MNRNINANDNPEQGRSPMNRSLGSSSTLDREEQFRSPMFREFRNDNIYRDEKGPYLRDDSGREIRGAEAQYVPSNSNYNDSQDDFQNEYYDSAYHKEKTERGRENDYDDYDDRRRMTDQYRPIREASKTQNKHQPGSKPYGNVYRRG